MKKTNTGCLRLPKETKPELRWTHERNLIPKRLIELARSGVYYESNVVEV